MASYAVILAAGKGTRMKSDLPKVLHLFNGKPLIHHVLQTAFASGFETLVPVVGYKKELVEQSVQQWVDQQSSPVKIEYAEQNEQKGTGHAVQMALHHLPQDESTVIILLGDVPALRQQTLKQATEQFATENAHGMVITMKLDDPQGYGRILRDENGRVTAIKEEKDADEVQKKVDEVNTGIFLFKASQLQELLPQLSNNNAQGEYYLTDMVELLVKNNRNMQAFIAADPVEFSGVNSVEQLKQLEQKVNRQKGRVS